MLHIFVFKSNFHKEVVVPNVSDVRNIMMNFLPTSSKTSTAEMWPLLTAEWSGVHPSSSPAFTTTRASSGSPQRILTICRIRKAVHIHVM